MQNIEIIEELIKSRLKEKAEIVQANFSATAKRPFLADEVIIGDVIYGAVITGAKATLEFLVEKGIINPNQLLISGNGKNNACTQKSKKGKN